ncbi:GNAT family N-acetyltransferase [Euzebyella saccharophila]|uniref:GNAT family N-acetyltransferase n=1 Tax=Euzebyella saccharophila TaxID=679664 RepID=A0ABV8JSW3_9FLAO|nr:GNAT family N-acetyltransferase [Euzebyella saccharophila]
MDEQHRYRLIKCQSSDLDNLVKISSETFRAAFEKQNDPVDFEKYMSEAFSADRLKKELNQKHASFYFLWDGDALAGYIKVNEFGAQSDLKIDEALELERIYVLQNYQGKGIGAHLIEEVKTIAKNRDKNFIWLGVWEENHSAIKFYEKNGFYKFGTHPYIVGDDKQTDWLMRYDLAV